MSEVENETEKEVKFVAYIRKTQVVHAIQWKGQNLKEIRTFVFDHETKRTKEFSFKLGDANKLIISINLKEMVIQEGGWLTHDQRGFVKVGDSEFQADYDEIVLEEPVMDVMNANVD